MVKTHLFDAAFISKHSTCLQIAFMLLTAPKILYFLTYLDIYIHELSMYVSNSLIHVTDSQTAYSGVRSEIEMHFIICSQTADKKQLLVKRIIFTKWSCCNWKSGVRSMRSSWILYVLSWWRKMIKMRWLWGDPFEEFVVGLWTDGAQHWSSSRMEAQSRQPREKSF